MIYKPNRLPLTSRENTRAKSTESTNKQTDRTKQELKFNAPRTNFKLLKFESNVTKDFRRFYDSGDLPLVIVHGVLNKLQWKCDIKTLDYSVFLPLFFEGRYNLKSYRIHHPSLKNLCV